MGMQPAYPDTVHFKGINRPTHIEATAHDLYVEGDLPADIDGAFYRAVHDPAYVPAREDEVVLSRDGMLSKIEFRNGRVNCGIKYVRTQRFLAEQKAGRALFGRYRNPYTDDPSVAGVDRTVANTTPYYHSGRLFMSKEDGLPYRMDPFDLSTIERWTYNNKLKSETLTAHPKLDPETGELFIFGYEADGLASTKVAYCIVDPDGELQSEQWFDAPYCAMMHDFAVTKDHAIFIAFPSIADLDRIKAGGPHWVHHQDQPSWIGIMPRYGKVDEMVWIKGPLGVHSYHVMNAWSEGSKVHIDHCLANTNLIPFIAEDSGISLDVDGGLTRWTVDITDPEAGVTEWKIGPLGELPIIDQSDFGKEYSRGWYLSLDPTKFTRIENGPADVVWNAIVRVQFPQGTVEMYSEGPGLAFSEPVHVPAKDAGHGGWLLFMVDRIIAEGFTKQEVWVLEADAMAKGPIAKVHMPFSTCGQVHGSWVPRHLLDQAREPAQATV